MSDEREDQELSNELDQELEQEEITSETTEDSSEVQQEEDPELGKAKQYGYLTKEQYIAKHGSEEGYKSPQEFNKFGESYEMIKSIKTKLDKTAQENAILLK